MRNAIPKSMSRLGMYRASGFRAACNIRRSSGVALLITLLMLSLITIIVVAFLGTMTWESTASRRNFEGQKARALAELGMKIGVAQLRSALGVGWDEPYVSFVKTPPTYYWSVSPGLLTRWSYNSTTPLASFALFSQPPVGNPSTALVDLNEPLSDGTYPIAGGTNAPNISVYWVNVLKNPAITAPSAANPMVGRYAFWIDDENAKININTADGTAKYQTNSFGLGTPMEVSLQELQTGGTNISTQTATNIVYIARTRGFNSPREILRTPGTSNIDLYTNNVFNLTVSSRSPDLNVFGQPKIALITTTTGNNAPYTGAVPARYNDATLGAPVQFYPDWAQLGTNSFVNSFNLMTNANPASPLPAAATDKNIVWPLTFWQEEADSFSLKSGYGSVVNPYPWANGQLIANYLAGTNAAGKPITWPAFSGSTAANYLQKYSARQIDSITMQILDYAGNCSTPDWGDGSYPTVRSTPHIFQGWLSGQLVSGAGRFPKVDKLLMEFTPYGQVGTYTFNGNSALNPFSPPHLTTACYVESWFPSGFQGVSYTHQDYGSIGGLNGSGVATYSTTGWGSRDQPAGVLNGQDYPAWTTNETIVTKLGGSATNVTYATPSQLPKSAFNGGPAIPDGTVNSLSYWGNNLLQTDQGIDWVGNPASIQDPDQAQATLYHPYLAAPTNSAFYNAASDPILGGGTATYTEDPVFNMDSYTIKGGLGVADWPPGQYRTASNGNNSLTKSVMATNVAGGAMHITGGMAIDVNGASRLSDAEVVPLESKRGAGQFNTGITNTFIPNNGGYLDEGMTGEPYTNLPVYNRVMQSVIPISATLTIPAMSPTSAAAGTPVWAFAYVQDPLVNKFPGDWISTSSSSGPPAAVAAMGMQYTTAGISEYPESATTMATLADPYSYWSPTVDNRAWETNSVDPPIIPRTARFPSVGYLQYVRTGIIPDDENTNHAGNAYSQQHGTPFRLLNFSPSTATNQALYYNGASTQSYPDWAMLDLFYEPTSLLGYGSPYESASFANASYSVYPNSGNPTMVAYQNTNSVNHLSLYGTYGGATSGRINPNGAVIYTTSVTTPTPGVSRLVPLEALLHGLVVNPSSYTQNTVGVVAGNTDCHLLTPNGSSLAASDEAAIASDIANYLTTNGPMRMPEEICNVPMVASYMSSVNATATGSATGYRNDLVRQIVGNLTTTSNTFSIWVAGQSIVKSKSSTNYGSYDSAAGDQVMATVRYHFVVERYLDPGSDGVYGNTVSPGTDGIVGTLDDPESAFAVPVNPGPINSNSPNYLYRVIYAEELR